MSVFGRENFVRAKKQIHVERILCVNGETAVLLSYSMERDHCRKAPFLLNLYLNMTGDNIFLSEVFDCLSRAEHEPNYITIYIYQLRVLVEKSSPKIS